MEKEKTNKPIHQIKVDGITVSCWKNSMKNKEGETYEYHTFSPAQRSYKDDQGQWQTTNSLRKHDLRKASLAYDRAYAWCCLTEEKPE